MLFVQTVLSSIGNAIFLVLVSERRLSKKVIGIFEDMHSRAYSDFIPNSGVVGRATPIKQCLEALDILGNIVD